jgi:hypothetical protein
VILLCQENCAVVEEIRIRVVTVDQQDFRNVSASWPAFDVDYDIERIRDVCLNRPVRKVNAAL